MVASTVACTRPPAATELGLELRDGYQVALYATGLQGPTQMIVGPDDRIWLAQLAGLESAGTGQVIALEMDGTLTVAPDGNLIYETSGSRRGNVAAEGSASLWSLDPADPSQPRLIAYGLKNAYAHAFDELGRLWVTEVADDPVNGGPPPDELNLVVPGADFGWPACYGDQLPATNYGGTETACAGTQPAVTVFPPGSTPTSVVASPWEADTLLVALWGPTQPSIVSVHIAVEAGEPRTLELSSFVTGLAHPQSLLVLPDGSLLVSDFESGSIYRLTHP